MKFLGRREKAAEGTTNARPKKPKPSVNRALLSTAANFKDGIRRTDLVLIYTPKSGFGGRLSGHETTNRAYRKHFLQKLKLLGLEMEDERSLVSDPPTHFIKVHATWRYLARTAEMLHTQVPIARAEESSKKIMPCFRVPEGPVVFEDTINVAFKKNHFKYYLNSEDVDSFFTPAQRTGMVAYEVDRTRIKMKSTDKRKAVDVADEKQNDPTEPKKAEKYVTFMWFLHHGVFQPYMSPHDSDVEAPKNIEVGDAALPVRMWLWKHWANPRNIFKKQPLDAVREYFGSEIGFYFAWLSHYTKMLILPAALSLLALGYGLYNLTSSPLTRAVCTDYVNVTLCRRCPNIICEYSLLGEHCTTAQITSVFDNYGTFVFSLFISIWAIFFQESWRRRQYDLASRWGTLSGTEELVRAEYLFGAKDTRKNPVTMKEEPYIKERDKRKRFLVSAVTVGVMVVLVVTFMIGMIVYRIATVQSRKLMNAALLKTLHISPKLFVSITASIMNLLVISIMSTIYPKIAWKLTQYEFPRTQSEFERNYTYKVVIFQFFNYYGTLLYLSFFAGKIVAPPHLLESFMTRCGPQGCMMEVTVQLIIVMTVKQLLQNFTEVSLPKVKNFIRRMRILKKPDEDNDKLEISQLEKDYLSNPVAEPTGFNDYLEMVIQYGFISMFAPAFPLGTFFALLNNILEIRLDAFSYIRDYRRPIPKDVAGIGPWMDILRLITKISVLVNGALIAFSGLSIESIYFRVHYPDTPIDKYFESSFSQFRTSHYCLRIDPSLCEFDFEQQRLNLGNETVYINGTAAYANETALMIKRIQALRFSERLNKSVESCVYRGQFYSPEVPELQYTHKPLYVQYLVAKIAFVIVFQNVITILQSTISGLMTTQSHENKTRTLKEQHLEREVEAKYAKDLAREKGEESSDSYAEYVDYGRRNETGINFDPGAESTNGKRTGGLSICNPRFRKRAKVLCC